MLMNDFLRAHLSKNDGKIFSVENLRIVADVEFAVAPLKKSLRSSVSAF